MDPELQAFINDCKTFRKPGQVKNQKNLTHLPSQIKNILNDANGNDVVATGVALFGYLADVIVAKKEEGIRVWNIIKLGYPGHAYTDLFAPFFDVSRTQLLWLQADKHLQTGPLAKVEIVLNIYFRWYVNTIELMRKLLVFADYCRRVEANQISLPDEKFGYLLYNGKEAPDSLRQETRGERKEIINRFYEKFYKKTLRHALAHGNVVMPLPYLVAVRQTDEQLDPTTGKAQPATAFIQNVYKSKANANEKNIEQVVDDFQEHADPCFQTARIFFSLYAWVESRHLNFLKKYYDRDTNGDALDVLDAMVMTVKDDPEGLHRWAPYA